MDVGSQRHLVAYSGTRWKWHEQDTFDKFNLIFKINNKFVFTFIWPLVNDVLCKLDSRGHALRRPDYFQDLNRLLYQLILWLIPLTIREVKRIIPAASSSFKMRMLSSRSASVSFRPM